VPAEMAELQREIELLRAKVEAHPEVKRFAVENLRLSEVRTAANPCKGSGGMLGQGRCGSACCWARCDEGQHATRARHGVGQHATRARHGVGQHALHAMT